MIPIKDFYKQKNNKASYKDSEVTQKTKGSADSYWEKNSPTSNGMRASNKFPMYGDDEVGPHVNLTNIPGP